MFKKLFYLIFVPTMAIGFLLTQWYLLTSSLTPEVLFSWKISPSIVWLFSFVAAALVMGLLSVKLGKWIDVSNKMLDASNKMTRDTLDGLSEVAVSDHTDAVIVEDTSRDNEDR